MHEWKKNSQFELILYPKTIILLNFISAVSGMHTSAIKNDTQGRFLSILRSIMPDNVATVYVFSHKMWKEWQDCA